MRIVITDWFFAGEPDLEREIAGSDFDLVVNKGSTGRGIAESDWAAADALVTYLADLRDTARLDRLERCRLIVRAGVGYDNIDIAHCARRGIAVCNTPDYGTTEVADHSIALLLSLRRGIVSYHNALQRDRVGGWSHEGAPMVARIRGTRLGIVGIGRIGTAVARRAKALDMEVAFYDPYAADGAELALGVQREHSLAALFAGCDAISINCPLTAETTGLIDAAVLAHARPGQVLVSTARGPIIDLDALHDALRDGRLGGAGLDVLPEEPPVAPHPLYAAFAAREPWLEGRLILTPHAAWYSAAGLHDLRAKSMRLAVDYLRGGRLRNGVNQHLLAPAARGG